MAITKTVYPRRPLYPDPETAAMTEAERLAEYKQSAAYQARQERYRQWEAQQAYLRYRQGEWADPQPAAQSKPWWQKVGIIRDLADSFPDGIDLVTGATSTARASWRLAFPSRFGSPLWEDIALEQFGREVRNGAITEKNILEELARLPNKNFRIYLPSP